MESSYSSMDSYNAIYLVNSLIDKQHYRDALEFIRLSVETTALLLNDFPKELETTEEESLILAKLYLIKQDIPQCVKYALRAGNQLESLDEFYYNSIFYRMMDYLIQNKENEELKTFILNHIQNEGCDSSYLGFLLEISEYGLLKEKIKILGKGNEDCREIIQHLLGVAYNELIDVFLDMGTENSHLMLTIIDALIINDKKEELKEYLEALPWDRLYHACLYIEDSVSTDLKLENENANLILSGDWKQEILTNFLIKNSKTSFKFIESMGKARAPYIGFCNAIMNMGTTNDTLYRNNKGLVTSREWARFIEYASLGMIHLSNVNAFEILKEILPSLESSTGESGSLLALGLMKTGTRDQEVVDYLLNWVRVPDGESALDCETIFGACLGLGLTLLESDDEKISQRLEELFSVDNTIVQEAAVYAMGLIYAGGGDKGVLATIKTVEESTEFPRVKRVCGISKALICALKATEFYTEETDLEDYFAGLNSLDGNARMGAVQTLGATFTATGVLRVIERLLPLINDPVDDVKYAAVVAIALVGYEDSDITISCLLPLSQNHSMHVRAATALVLGLFNCGSGDKTLCTVVEALLYDSDDLVRQAACMGMGFLLAQMNPVLIDNYKRSIDRINHMIVSKSEAMSVKIGATIGRSLAEAGGRSVIFSLRNLTGYLEVKRVVGALLFIQSWFWYPLMPFISLCVLPTPIFFFDQNLNQTTNEFKNSSEYYDHLIKIPEVRRSRKNKHLKESDYKDVVITAPKGLKSGDRLTQLERNSNEIESVVVFKNDDVSG